MASNRASCILSGASNKVASARLVNLFLAAEFRHGLSIAVFGNFLVGDSYVAFASTLDEMSDARCGKPSRFWRKPPRDKCENCDRSHDDWCI